MGEKTLQKVEVPLYKQLKTILKELIEKGKIKAGERILSENELISRFNVSSTTARRALNELVSEGFLYRIQGKGTFVADFKKLRTHPTVGVVVETEEISHLPFTRYLPSQLQSKGYFTTVMDIRNNLKPHLEKFLTGKYVGLITDGYSIFPFESLSKLKKSAHLIFIHRFEGPKKYKAAYVLSDYTKGGYITARHLLGGGRKNILILSFEIKPNWISDLFYKGCLKAKKEYGGNFTYLIARETSPQTYREIFKSSQRPDGIISFGDFRVIPVLKILKELGLKVPEDVAIIGYYNTPWAEGYNLTSVSIKEKAIAEKAVEMLEKSRAEEIYIEPELVFRDSCPEELG